MNAQTTFDLLWSHRIGGVVHVSVSPDGQLIAAVSSETGAYAFAADGGQLWAKRPASGQGFKSVAVSSDGRYVVAGQDDEPPVGRAGVYLYDAETGNELWSNETKGLVWSVGISSDGRYVVAGSADHHVYFFQRDNGNWLWTYEARLAITSVAISSDGRYIAAAGNDGIYMFDRASERPIWNYSQYGEFYSVSISPDGQYVVGGYLRSVILIRRDGAVLWNSPIGGDPWAVTISNDSQFVVVGTEGPANEIRLLTRENATTAWHHSLEKPVESVAISINDNYVVAGGDDNQVHVFNRDTGSYLFNYTTDNKVFSVALSSDGRSVAAGGAGAAHLFTQVPATAQGTFPLTIAYYLFVGAIVVIIAASFVIVRRRRVKQISPEMLGSRPAIRAQYDVALSFAGEDRSSAEQLARCLTENDVRVFYDKYEEATLWGKDLYEHLAWVYRDAARYCVLFISKHYANRLWTTHERRNAQARAFREKEEYILPIRLDDTEIPGLPETVGYVDLRRQSIDEVCRLVLQKLSSSPK